MKKKFGCSAAVIGAILCVAGLALFIKTGIGSMHARRVASIPLTVGRPMRSDLISVDTNALCAISVAATVRTKYPSFSFPFRYSVVDASGTVLSSGQTVFGDRSGAVWTTRTMTSADGQYRHEFGYDSFAVKPPGRIRVEAQLDADTRINPYRVEDMTLTVYDNAIEQRRPVTVATVLVIAGVVLGALGLIMFVATKAGSVTGH